MSLAAGVNWPEVAKVLEIALSVLRYLFGLGFVVVAIKFFWQVAKAVNDFVHKQDDLASMAKGIADNAKVFADRVTTILERHDDWLNDHQAQLAVINHELGIVPADKPATHHRRHRSRRRDDHAPTDARLDEESSTNDANDTGID